ncbi:MAG: RNA polymerase sigma factor [Bacteroidetes bacterium]|nr:RNA polymerase sigma factor [Bacteroidota bacterium]
MNNERYNQLVKEHTGALYKFLYKSVRDKDAVNDMLQDTFLKLWEHKENIQAGKEKSWLFTTGYHFMLKYIEKEKKHFHSDEPIHVPVKPNNEFETKELIDLLLMKLPPLQKSILLLRDMEGYDYKEIGEILSLNESQVKVYIFRARQKVRDELKALNIDLNL